MQVRGSTLPSRFGLTTKRKPNSLFFTKFLSVSFTASHPNCPAVSVMKDEMGLKDWRAS